MARTNETPPAPWENKASDKDHESLVEIGSAVLIGGGAAWLLWKTARSITLNDDGSTPGTGILSWFAAGATFVFGLGLAAWGGSKAKNYAQSDIIPRIENWWNRNTAAPSANAQDRTATERMAGADDRRSVEIESQRLPDGRTASSGRNLR